MPEKDEKILEETQKLESAEGGGKDFFLFSQVIMQIAFLLY